MPLTTLLTFACTSTILHLIFVYYLASPTAPFLKQCYNTNKIYDATHFPIPLLKKKPLKVIHTYSKYLIFNASSVQ